MGAVYGWIGPAQPGRRVLLRRPLRYGTSRLSPPSVAIQTIPSAAAMA